MWTMAHSPPPRNRLLLEYVILWPDALHNAGKDKRCKHVRMRHSTIHYTFDVLNNHEWVGNLSGVTARFSLEIILIIYYVRLYALVCD